MRHSLGMHLLFVVLSASTAIAGVSVEYARQADFSQYRSFSWLEEVVVEDARLAQWIRAAVTRELQAKGLKKVERGGDLLVRARVTMREEGRQAIDILRNDGGWLDEATAVTPTGEYIEEVGVGTVLVALLDGHSKMDVWQGIVGAVARPELGKKSEKRINKAIARLFKRFPPE